MSGHIVLHVRLFALARQLAGAGEIDLSLAAPATVREVRRALAETCPGLAGLVPQMLFAVNSEYAADTTPVSAECEIACIPPVSGGG